MLVYSPPNLEVPSHYPVAQSPDSEGYVDSKYQAKKLKTVMDQLQNEALKTDIGRAAARIEDSFDLAKEIKGLAMKYEKDFWHVIVGKKFTFSITNEQLSGPLVLTYGDTKIVLFRQQGIKRTVNWKGISTWVGNVILAFVVFMTLISIVKCGEGSNSWLCEHQSSLQFIALTVIMTKVMRKLVGKIRERKAKVKTS